MHYLYKILCTINQKVYIGQTIDISKRWSQHRNEARKEEPSMIINRAMKKHGIENFTFEIIATTLNQENANNIETELVKQYESHISTGKGYNVSLGGFNAPKTEEWKKAVRESWDSHSQEEKETIRKKMSESAKQRIIDYPNTNPVNYGFTGSDLTEESRKRMSESKKGCKGPNKGKKFSEEWRANLVSNHASKKEGFISPNKGKPVSKEQKQQISNTLTGYKHTQEAKANMSKSKIGNTNCVGRVPWNKGKTGECKFSSEQINRMKELRTLGMSHEKIAKEIGCNWKSVVKWTQ
jgi:group I intron endonuclease